ncbi:MAG: glycosyltransferase family 1 protein [Caldilineaceae bacterium]|nr:glycosyltransferase family 1 protein [Caldilineaceae bacterium]
MKFLFATVPGDGHFNTLTGIAMHLRDAGHDVRWYAGPHYIPKVQRLGIPVYPYQRAREVTGESLDTLFPERVKLHGPALIRFDAKNVMIANVGHYFEDIEEINQSFPFDIFFCDGAFYAMKLVKEKLGKQVYTVGIGPSVETSKDVPPNFIGLRPAKTAIGKRIHQGLRALMEWMVMNDVKTFYNDILAAHGLAPVDGSLFDVSYRSPDVIFQSGVPGFAYPRREVNPKEKYVGALLPYKASILRAFNQPEKLTKYKPVILISQGTVDNKEPEKLIIPALEALKDSGALLIATTGYHDTEALRKAFPQENIVIEDFVDFDFILDYTDLFICNGGYGSVLLSLSKGVPLLTAGIREGKNDVNAHVDFFKVGIDLRTEKPKPRAIRRAAERLLHEPQWKQNVVRLRDELNRYHPYELIDAYLANDKVDDSCVHANIHSKT